VAGDPYCGNCGYNLRGATQSSKCPECGRPLVDVLQRNPVRTASRRYKSPITLFGLPLIHIAFGPHEDETRGVAKGIIAIGDIAIGWFACGGFATGIIACGGMAIGLISLAGLALGGLACGGLGIGAVGIGGAAVGGLALGGGAIGYVAEGGGAIGIYAHGGGAVGRYIMAPYRADPEARRFFDQFHARLGIGADVGVTRGVTIAAWVFAATLGLATLLALILLIAYRLKPRPPTPAEFR
jgi:predicted RNA-binding Zn-ribbon protein involved in translation (DUF1610 family)